MPQGTPTPENTPEQNPAATPVAAGSASATPEAPAPEVLDPLWQNNVPTDLKPRDIPKATDTLERENNYSKNDDIRNQIQNVRSGQWELNMRNERYNAAHGRGIIGTIKGFFVGEGRAEMVNNRVVITTGDIRYDSAQCDAVLTDWQNELLRKVASEVLKSGTTLGIATLIAIIAGTGLSAVAIPAVLGALVGRAATEGLRSAISGERNLRQDLEAARVSYFQKARHLADDIPDEYTPELAGDIPREVYITNRNNKIKSFIDFVHQYEQLCVQIERSGRRQRNATGDVSVTDRQGRPTVDGAPVIDTERTGIPPEPNPTPSEPMPATSAGPDLVRGTELTQHSDVAPDAQRIRDLEDAIQHRKKFWDITTEVVGAASGLATGVYNLIHGGLSHLQGTMYNRMTQDLTNGKVVEHIGMNGDKLGFAKEHAVQKIGDQLVYLYHSVQERIGSLAAHAHEIGQSGAQISGHAMTGVPDRIGEFGAHALGATTDSLELQRAFITEASRRVYEQVAGVFTALIAQAGIGTGIASADAARYDKFRQDEMKKDEQERRRKQPDTLTINETLKQETVESGAHFPAVGDYYLYIKNLSLEPETPGNERRYKIEAINKNGSVLVRVIRPGVKEKYNTTRIIKITDLIRPDSPEGAHYNYIMPVENEEEAIPAETPDEDKDKKSGTEESSPPSSGGSPGDDDEEEDGGLDEGTPESPAPSSDEEVAEGGGPEPSDVVASEEEHKNEKEMSEKGEIKNDHFETAAARRTHAGENKSPHETYWFDNSGDNSQILVSLKKPETDKDMSLKDLAARVSARFGDLYPENGSAKDINAAMKQACEKTAQEFHIAPNNPDYSWTIVAMTKTGKFYGYRFNKDKSEVFQVGNDGKTVIKSKESREINGHIDPNAPAEFYSGNFADGVKIALLDQTLSAGDRGKDSEKFNIYNPRQAILAQNKPSRDLIDELLEKVATGYPKYEELCGIVAKYKSPETKASEKKIKATLYKDGEPVTEKRELKANATLRIENFHSESDPTKTGEAFPVIRFANNTNDILVYMQFVGEDKKLKESGSEQVKSFESKEKLQQWLDKYKVEFAADSPEQLQAAIDANQSKI